jgi:hypothetical protein
LESAIFLRKTLPARDPILLAEDALAEETGSRRGAEAVLPGSPRLSFGSRLAFSAKPQNLGGNGALADLKKVSAEESPGISFARNRGSSGKIELARRKAISPVGGEAARKARPLRYRLRVPLRLGTEGHMDGTRSDKGARPTIKKYKVSTSTSVRIVRR